MPDNISPFLGNQPDNKNQPPEKPKPQAEEKIKFNEANAASNDNVAIHTMKKDLENIKNPNYFNAPDNTPVVKPAAPAERPIGAPFQGRTSTSPFLSKENKKVENEPARPAASANAPEHHFNWTKMIVSAVILFVMLLSASSGYYFWMTRFNSQPPQETAQTLPPPPEPAPSLSTSNPNYLSVDMDNADSTSIKESINKYVKEVSGQKPESPVEFIVRDLANNPVTFSKFAVKIGITFPAEITASLGSNFSLFIFNDNDNVRLGLAIDSTDSTNEKLKDALSKEEANLPKDLEPLFLTTTYTLENREFNTSYYGGAEIRYRNIISPEELSIDYTIFRNKLVVGTTKMTLRSIIDSLTNSGDQAESGDITGGTGNN